MLLKYIEAFSFYYLLVLASDTEGERIDSISLPLSNHPPCFDLSINNRFSVRPALCSLKGSSKWCTAKDLVTEGKFASFRTIPQSLAILNTDKTLTGEWRNLITRSRTSHGIEIEFLASLKGFHSPKCFTFLAKAGLWGFYLTLLCTLSFVCMFGWETLWCTYSGVKKY